MIDSRMLPVWQHRQEIIDALAENQVIIVESPTGSGKTTQIPLILMEAGYALHGIIGITQPRRIATTSVCSYIQSNLSSGNYPSTYCGYKMRFYDTTDENTRIKILTDGMLLQELKTDSLLSEYSVVMVDEAHERSLNIDFILGMLKNIISGRPEFRVIVSSATINTKSFSRFFGNAPVISIQTKLFEIKTKYVPLPQNNPKNGQDTSTIMCRSVCNIINDLLDGFKKSCWKDNLDTLVFLPGEADIKTASVYLHTECDVSHLQIYQLYGRLSKEEQDLVFSETAAGKMKVVLATNIAETSLTINGIRCVIDSGLAKINFYNQDDFTSALVTRPISRSSAMQRQGRSGRTAPGVCYRLYSKENYSERPLYSLQEILRTDLSEVVLRMVDLGITDFESFPFITKPDRNALISGENTLKLIGAIDESRHLTSIGSMMVQFPLLPRLSRCAVEAIMEHPDYILPVMVCISFLSCRTPFLFPQGEEDIARNAQRRFACQWGDFISYQTIYRDYSSLKDQKEKENFCNTYYLDIQSMDEIVHVIQQLCSIVRDMGVPVMSLPAGFGENESREVLLCMASGLIQYICTGIKRNVYSTITTDEIYIHPGSAYFRDPPQYLLAGEIVMTTKMYARTVSPLSESWMKSLPPSVLKSLESKAKAAGKKKETHTDDSEGSYSQNDKLVHLFGFTLHTISVRSGKKSSSLAVIPASQLSSLSKAYRKARRRPKDIRACILFKGHYAVFNEKLSDIARLSGRLNLNEDTQIIKPCQTVFSTENISQLPKYLSQLMNLAECRKDKSRLGFVELISSGNSFIFHVNPNYSDAIGNSAYTLLGISELYDDSAFRDAYNKLVHLLD